jgi:hypothetical protein
MDGRNWTTTGRFNRLPFIPRSRCCLLGVLGVLGGSILFFPGCDKTAPSADGDATATNARGAAEPSVAQVDKELADSIAAKGTAEARDWLDPKHANHVMWKTWDKPEARKQVDAIYAAGATKVWAVDPVSIKDDDPAAGQIVAQFVVELPTDPAKRKAVFDWIANWEKEIEEDHPTKDVGQKYYEINLDL